MRRLLLGALLVLLALGAGAQPFGNEWIRYDQRYWHLEVPREGIFRIDSTALANAGVPLATIDPRGLQLHGREQQVPIYVQGEADGVFNATDFIEFYAKGNDAWMDSALWDSPAHISNPFYSMVCDTMQYFLTYGPPTDALRAKVDPMGSWQGRPALPWWWAKGIYFQPNYYFIGDRTSADASSSMLNEGEGYFDVNGTSSAGADAVRGVDIPTPDPYLQPDAPPSVLQLASVGVNNAANGVCPNHHLRASIGSMPLMDTVFTGYRLINKTFTIPSSLLGATNTQVTLTIPHDLEAACTFGGLPANYPDNQGIAYQTLRYPRQFDLRQVGYLFNLDVPAGLADTVHVAFNIWGDPTVYAFGPTVERLPCVFDNGLWHLLVPMTPGQERHLYICSSYGLNTITTLAPVNGDGFFHDLSQNLPDSALIIVTHERLMTEALAYAHYRETNVHNRYSTIVSDVAELYQQFGGGVPRHPMAIRRYAGFVLAHAPTRPHGLFLVGKAVRAPLVGGYSLANSGYRSDPAAAAACLVPSFGYPPSDMQFTLGLGGDPRDMPVPVGRLAARTPADVQHYREKVESVESMPPGAWMKNILHFRGGFNAQEWAEFDEALEGYRHFAEDTCFSGRVMKFVKNGGGIIQSASADSVYNLVSQGVTLMTFFAHAFGGGFDITVDDPANYQWNGKYPTVIGNSCYTGNIHLADAASASEQFVLPANAGAVAFISSVDIGLSAYLRNYTEFFYKSFSQVNYGKSIGDHMRYAIYEQLVNQDLNALNSAQTFTLHGDPTLVMNSPRNVDYEVTDADLTLAPAQVTADVDSFRVKAVIRNIGKGTNAPFSMAAERTLLEEGQLLPAVVRQVSLPHFQDTVTFTLPTLGHTGGQGLNALDVRANLDPQAQLDEVNLMNNRAHLEFQVTSGDLLPVYPYDLAITPDAAPLLQASTADPFAEHRNYIFQIDTTDLFNSPVMEQGTVSAPGGVLHWQPQQIYGLNNTVDSLVFFWRCTLDSLGSGGNYNWHEFSFQHIPNKRGWGQSHYFQFKNNGYNLIDYDRPDRDFDYYTGLRSVGCEIWGNNVNLVKWTKDLEPQEGYGCYAYPALHVAVVDPFDFSTWLSRFNGAGRFFGNVNDNGACRQRQERYFIFWDHVASQLQGMGDMVTTGVPDGHFLLVYTYRYLARSVIQATDPGLFAQMGSIGATNLASGAVPDSVPYIFFCKKGDPSSVVELWGDSLTARIDTTILVTVNAHSGTIVSPRAGPALAWDALYWDSRPRLPYDSTHVLVTGIGAQGNEQQVLDLPNEPDSLIGLEAVVPAAQYPQLRLTGKFWNDSLATPHPSHLERWQLLGSPAPECAIDPPSGYWAELDSVFEGQPARLMVAIRNISEFDMDSLLVAAWVVGQDNQRHLVHYKRNARLLAGGILADTIAFSTQGLSGANTLIVEANPMDTGTTRYDQPEQYHFNNIATRRFNTQRDRENPVLDVTFDGIHILDGDIVSAKPEIQMVLDDENRTLLLDSPEDTAYFKVFLTDPSGQVQRIFFHQGGQDLMQFIPANGPANVSKVMYRPSLGRDGVYQLLVRATDISRNNSGDHDLSIKFEVINRPTITEVLNYPNPFTTSTRFVFTLTGSETPTAMRVQIMTISGRVVREVSMAEMGALHVGRNITDFAWDGTDQFGDRLARGVYLYRVIAQLHGQDIEYRETGAGSYFTKGFGKMYLLR